jgi:hypothetical protein
MREHWTRLPWQVQYNLCIVIDVFGQRVFTASKNVTLHAGKIRKSCQEIREMWPTIPKRKPIDGKDDSGQLNFPE